MPHLHVRSALIRAIPSSPAAAVELRTALDKALQMLQQPGQPTGTGTLN